MNSSVQKTLIQIKRSFRHGVWLAIGAIGLLMIAWYWALWGIGADVEQGGVYRLLFVHVSVAWGAFFWIGLSALFGVVLLCRRDEAARTLADIRSAVAAQWGVWLSLAVLITGSFWGRPTWGVWWDWDPRLTSSLVMFLIGCAYLAVRHFTLDIRAKQTLSAVVTILNAVHVPIVYLSVNLWRSLHQPQTFVYAKHNVSSDIALCLIFNVLAFFFVTIILYQLRVYVFQIQDILAQLRAQDESSHH